MLQGGGVNSVDAYVLPALRGSIQKNDKSRWSFSDWQNWWRLRRADAGLSPATVDMDVFQPFDLLFISAVSIKSLI